MATNTDTIVTEFVAVDKMTPAFGKLAEAYDRLHSQNAKLINDLADMQDRASHFEKLQRSIDAVNDSVIRDARSTEGREVVWQRLPPS